MSKFNMILALATLTMSSVSVYAADTGTLTFNGSVLSDSCEITTSAGADQTITLTPAYVSDFSGSGSTPATTKKNFTIDISNCAAGSYVISFPVSSNASYLTGDYISNQSTSTSVANNVAFALYDGTSSTTPITLSNGPNSTAQTVAEGGTGAASFPFAVNYIQTSDSTVTAGNVTGTLKYQIAYE